MSLDIFSMGFLGTPVCVLRLRNIKILRKQSFLVSRKFNEFSRCFKVIPRPLGRNFWYKELFLQFLYKKDIVFLCAQRLVVFGILETIWFLWYHKIRLLNNCCFSHPVLQVAGATIMTNFHDFQDLFDWALCKVLFYQLEKSFHS